MNTKLLKKEQLTADVIELTWAKPEGFDYIPGQFIKFSFGTVEEPIRRNYSLASHPAENFLTSIIKLATAGKASEIFNALTPDDVVSFDGPYGHFVLSEITRPLIFVATGTGISPEFSMIKEVIKYKPTTQPVKVFFGLKNMENIYLREEFEELKKLKPDFDYTFCLSNKVVAGENIILKRTTNYITEIWDTLPDADWYICGIPKAIMDTEKLLANKGVPNGQIHFEHFNPAKK